jgi:uncharacterized DUF497 family protein
MEFEWDPAKNEINLAKHGIDFAKAALVFYDPHHIKVETSKPEHGEIRMKAIGMVEAELFVLIYTDRGSNRRIISAKRSRPNERRDYREGKERT